MSVLKELDWPAEWSTAPFGRLVDRSKAAGRPHSQPLSVYLDQGVVPRSSRDDNHNQLGADLSTYLVVRPGDLVFNKLRTWQGGLGVSRYDGIVSPAYFVCHPHAELLPGFAHYLMRSAIYLQELTRVSKWMPPAQFDIAWEDLGAVQVMLPPVLQQRAIADYLDAETARMDALIALRRRQVELIAERFRAVREAHMRRLLEQHGVVPLKRLAWRIEQGWSPEDQCRVHWRVRRLPEQETPGRS